MKQIRQHGRKKVRGPQRGSEKALSTLTLLVPIFYNPTASGVVIPVESWKHQQTEAEIQQHFTGYSVSYIQGWYRSSKNGEEFHDRNRRFEIDLTVTPALKHFLCDWKKTLKQRFKQEAIYMKLSAPIRWV
jgi:hypothetical protein